MEVHGNISHAMRENYNEYGVDEYYRKVAASYRNPFYPSIKQAIWGIMNKWWSEEGRNLEMKSIRILDMAAGSGEATECLLEWAESGKGQSQPGSSPMPVISGRPPVPSPGRAFIPPGARAKMGLAPSLPPDLTLDIVATDPYTAPAYKSRTGRTCHPLSFGDLAAGTFPEETAGEEAIESESQETFDIVVCSFALHLVETSSELFALMYELSSRARWFILLAPHKKPEIKDSWGWIRWDMEKWQGSNQHSREAGLEIVKDKTRLRLYRSSQL